MKDRKKSSIVFVILGLIVGYLSFWMTGEFETNVLQPFVAILILVLGAEFMRIALKINKKFKWFLSNGGWIYIFIWFITWVIFYNL